VIDRRPEGCAVLCGNVVGFDALLLPWSDPAAQWGLGVFETLAVREAAPRHLDGHLSRLTAAALRLGVPLPPASELRRAVGLVADGTGGESSWLKILVSRSGAWAVFAGPNDLREFGRAVSAVVLPWRRHRTDPTAGIKSMAYAASILGLEEARRLGADEGLWLNERGHVFQACTGNVFVVRGRAVDTPSLEDGARDGVVRAWAIEALRALGLSVRQSKIRIATLRAADEVFLTSSLCGVRPVVRVDARNVRGGTAGLISRRLGEQLTADEASHEVSDDRGTSRGAR
jgi:branched-subunit amino acid aminotransferase/4-amino-4-deoxychorismate lyase